MCGLAVAGAVTTMLLISLVVGATFTVARETITAFIGKYVFIAINQRIIQHTKTHILFNLCSCPAGGHFSPPPRLLRKTRAMGSVCHLPRRDGGGFKSGGQCSPLQFSIINYPLSIRKRAAGVSGMLPLWKTVK